MRTDKKKKTVTKAALRRKAEARLAKLVGSLRENVEGSTAEIVHELRVHQIELEMQNDELRHAQEAIEASRTKYSDLYDFAPVGYLMLDRNGLVLEANLMVCQMLGIERANLIRKPLSLYVDRASQQALYLHRTSLTRTDEQQNCEITMLRADKHTIEARLESVASYDTEGGLTFCRTAIADITARKLAERALELSQESLRRQADHLESRVGERTAELAQTVEKLREEVERRRSAEVGLKTQAQQLRRLASELTLTEQRERRRLAHVLHDHLQQLLVAARLRIALLRREESHSVLSVATEVDELIIQSIDVSRTLTGELSPPILHEKGLRAAIVWLQRWMKEKHGLDVELDMAEDTGYVESDIGAMMFHSMRELLFNVVKHSGARHARVQVDRLDGRIRAVISDEGSGFAPLETASDPPLGGFGLFGTRERMAVMGGSLSVESAPGKGTRVTLISPPLTASEPETPVPAVDLSSLPAAVRQRVVRPAKNRTGNEIRVMLVDDHMIMRQGLSRLLDGEPDIEVVGEAGDGHTAIEMARQLLPDVILMDIGLPGMDGIEATRIIHAEMPAVKVIGLSMFEAPERADQMREAGAAFYISKNEASESLVAAVRSCCQTT